MAVVSVTIDSIAAGGDGVGRTNGLVVFVPRTAPADVVTAQISGKAHFARGNLTSIVTASPFRIEPPCPHYTRDKCGGCQLQHMTYDAQLAAKKLVIRDAIQRIGKRQIDTPVIERSPQEWRYRTKLTLAMRRRGPRWIAGLHPYDNPAQVFALADCPITDRQVVAAWREVMEADAYFPDAKALRGSVRITGDGATFVMIGGRSWGARDQFAAAVPSLSAVWWEPDDKPRRLLFDNRRERTPSASFAQINAGMAEILRNHIFERARSYEPRSVVDAYAGAGHTSAALSELGIRVTAIELDADAARWSASRLREPSRSIQARAEDALPGVLPADVVILNPPRAGVDQRVATTLESEAEHVRA
ncbi:MAG: class I SAM-dependent RNA methyltransferase, partial [Gemmatimonadaceae bacterium]